MKKRKKGQWKGNIFLSYLVNEYSLEPKKLSSQVLRKLLSLAISITPITISKTEPWASFIYREKGIRLLPLQRDVIRYLQYSPGLNFSYV